MAEYWYIQNLNNSGKLAINKHVFDEIVTIATNNINGVSVKDKKANKGLFSFHRPVQCDIVNGKVLIELDVNIKQGQNVERLCSSIQKEIADSLTTMVELVPFSIKVKVAAII
jgi:uncharacterized alkaline shock family protein YloU